MESNPYETPQIDQTQAQTTEASLSIWSIPIDIMASWVPFGMFMFLLLPSIHELLTADVGRLVFELSIIVISIALGCFVTLKRLVMLVKRLAARV